MVADARLTLLLDVPNFTTGGYLAVASDDATAGERRETEKSNETHAALWRIRVRRDSATAEFRNGTDLRCTASEQVVYRADEHALTLRIVRSRRDERATKLAPVKGNGRCTPEIWIGSAAGTLNRPFTISAVRNAQELVFGVSARVDKWQSNAAWDAFGHLEFARLVSAWRQRYSCAYRVRQWRIEGMVPILRAAGVTAALTAAARLCAGQTPALVTALLADSKVRAALDVAQASESQTIEDQVRFCEVPAPPFKETARADVLRRAFQDLGLRNVRVDKVGNVLGERPGVARSPRLLLASHLDTVFPEGTSVKVTRDRQGVLRGPGISDNCRGLAVLVSVARALRDANVQTGGPVTFVANVGEEGLGDLRGMKALFEDTMKGQVDRFVSIDGGGLYVTNVGVGSHRYRITFIGPGGHSFGAFGAPNPANALGRAVATMADLQVPTVPRTTFNVGRIGGGSSVNAIPAEAWMEIDLRSSDAAQLDALDARVQAVIDAAVAEENRRWRAGERVTVTKKRVGNRPAASLPASAPIVQTIQAVARAILGSSVPLSEGSSDANLPLSLGIPSVTIGGGGQGEQAHAAGEWWDPTDSWKGTQNAVLVTVALSQP